MKRKKARTRPRRRTAGRQTPKRAARSPGLLTRQELAALLGYGPQRLAKFSEEGMPVAERGRGGRASLYDEQAVRAWLTARNGAPGPGGESPHAEAARQRARKELAQAELAEQLVKARSRELLPAHEVERVWSAERDAIRTAILALPVQAARVARIATLEGEIGVERTLKEIAHDILRELAAGTHVKKGATDGTRHTGNAGNAATGTE